MARLNGTEIGAVLTKPNPKPVGENCGPIVTSSHSPVPAPRSQPSVSFPPNNTILVNHTRFLPFGFGVRNQGHAPPDQRRVWGAYSFGAG
eukprot:1682994-Rhodomonas_salina.3